MRSVSRSLPVPASSAWRLLTDTRAWPLWGPSVRAVECPTRFIGPGVEGRVRTPVGTWIPFTVTAWEEGHYWAWRVAGVPATGHQVDPDGPDRCRVAFLVPRWAPFYTLVCERALDRLEHIAGRMRSGAADGGE